MGEMLTKCPTCGYPITCPGCLDYTCPICGEDLTPEEDDDDEEELS